MIHHDFIKIYGVDLAYKTDNFAMIELLFVEECGVRYRQMRITEFV